MGPYPAALPASYDPLGSSPDLPGWRGLLISNASWFQPLPNRGCPPSVSALDCVNYESNGGLYPNCDLAVHPVGGCLGSCGFLTAELCSISRSAGWRLATVMGPRCPITAPP